MDFIPIEEKPKDKWDILIRIILPIGVFALICWQLIPIMLKELS